MKMYVIMDEATGKYFIKGAYTGWADNIEDTTVYLKEKTAKQVCTMMRNNRKPRAVIRMFDTIDLSTCDDCAFLNGTRCSDLDKSIRRTDLRLHGRNCKHFKYEDKNVASK